MHETVNSRFRFFLFGVVTTLVATAIAMVLAERQLEVRAHAKPGSARVAPWGEIDATPLPLANPDGILPDQTSRLQMPRWYFENYSELQVAQLFRRCELRPMQKSILLDKRIWTVTSNACILTPPEPVIWSLSSRARGIIYSALADCPSNYAQCFPFRFAPQSFEEYLKGTGLTEQDLGKIKRLAYTNAGSVCFTDLKPLHDLLKPDEFEDLVAALYTVPAFTLRVRIPPEANLDTVIHYWGKGGREKRIAPLLKGLTRVPGGGVINISYLLPTFARVRLYTYPETWNDPTAPRQDCFYSSMNFFNDPPNTNFFSRDYTKRVLGTDYEPTEASPEFGDLILLLNGEGGGIHMCVYLADDFVFTKNGVNRAEPWVIMRMSDMFAVYFGPQKSGKTVVFRHKTEHGHPDLPAS